VNHCELKKKLHSCGSFAFAFLAVACDIHAERHLAKAGGSKRKGRGIAHPWNEAIARVERAKRSGGLHKRSAEDWGNPLRARGAELPLGALAVASAMARPVLLAGVAIAALRDGVAGRNRPARGGSGKLAASSAARLKRGAGAPLNHLYFLRELGFSSLKLL